MTPTMTLGIGLRQDPRGVRFLVSEVPLYHGCLMFSSALFGDFRPSDVFLLFSQFQYPSRAGVRLFKFNRQPPEENSSSDFKNGDAP